MRFCVVLDEGGKKPQSRVERLIGRKRQLENVDACRQRDQTERCGERLRAEGRQQKNAKRARTENGRIEPQDEAEKISPSSPMRMAEAAEKRYPEGRACSRTADCVTFSADEFVGIR